MLTVKRVGKEIVEIALEFGKVNNNGIIRHVLEDIDLIPGFDTRKEKGKNL